MFVHVIQNKNPHLTQRMAVFLVHLIHGLAEAVSLSLVYPQAALSLPQPSVVLVPFMLPSS